MSLETTMNEDSFSFSFAAQKELLRERILADARAARELLHSQVDQVLLVAFDQVSSSAQVATNAYKLAQVQNPPKDPKDFEEGGSGGNLILQNMLTQLETLRGGRKSVNSGGYGYGRSSLGSSSRAETPLSLEMIVPLFSYFVGHQPQPQPIPQPQLRQQKPIKERKSADSKLSAAAAKKCSPVNKGSSFAAASSTSSSLSSSSRSFGESSASASTTTTKALARKRNNNSHNHNKSNNNISMDNKSIIIDSSIVDEKPLEWSPSSSGYSSTEEDLLIRSSTSIKNNNNNSHLPLDLSIKSVCKSWLQPNKFPLKVPKVVMKVKKEEEADSFTPLTMKDLIKNSKNSSSSSSSKPTAFVLPIKKRKYAEMDSTTTAVVAVKAEPATTSSPKAIVFQDELINNFAQANRKENMLTVGRKCLIEDCPMFFPADKRAMHAHMAADHGVLQFACQVVGCTASFDAQQGLTTHLSDVHSTTTSFGCPKCGKHFRKYEQMSHHIYAEHAVGVFRCAMAGCAFEGSRRSEISRHFEKEHRKYSCAQCGRSFTYTGHLRTHERTHLRVKPFSCSWGEGCSYVTENKSHAVSHIRTRHFGLPPTVKLQRALGIEDPRDPLQWLQIDHELIERTRLAFKEEAMKRRRQEEEEEGMVVKAEEVEIGVEPLFAEAALLLG